MSKPEKELKDFAKTTSLKPGEKIVVALKVKATDLASYEETSHSWVIDTGIYQFKLGTSSKDIKAVLEANVDMQKKNVNDILKQRTVFRRLSN